MEALEQKNDCIRCRIDYHVVVAPRAVVTATKQHQSRWSNPLQHFVLLVQEVCRRTEVGGELGRPLVRNFRYFFQRIIKNLTDPKRE